MKRFSLIEVVIAMAILALSVTGLLQLLTAGQKRTMQAWDKWYNMHRIMQAAEYLMLEDEEAESVPDEFFPYDDSTIRFAWEDLEDDEVPEDLNNQENQLPLKVLKIELVRNQDGKVLEELKIDRISYADASSSSDSPQTRRNEQ